MLFMLTYLSTTWSELWVQMDTAMMLHFNVQTPHHLPGGAAATAGAASNGLVGPLPLRAGRRGLATAQSVASGQTSVDGCAALQCPKPARLPVDLNLPAPHCVIRLGATPQM